MFVFAILNPFLSFSQTEEEQLKIDSIRLAQIGLKDTSLASNILELGRAYTDVNKDTSLKYLFKAQQMSESLNYGLGIFRSNHCIGDVYSDKGKFDISVKFLENAIKVAKENNDSWRLNEAYLTIGISNHHLGKYDIALDYYQKYRSYFKDKKTDNLCLILGNIGRVYSDLGDKETALNYYLKEDSIAKNLESPLRIVGAKNHLGAWYNEQEDLEKASEYFYEAINIAVENGLHKQVGTGYNNIAISKFFEGKVDSSEYFFKKSLEYREKYSNITDVSDSYLNLGTLQSMTGNHDKAIPFFNKSLSLSSKARAMTNVKELYELLAEEYAATNDFENAFKYQKLFSTLNDSLKRVSLRESIADKEVLYNLKATQSELENSIKNEKLQAKLKDQANEARENAEKARENEKSRNNIITLSSIIGGALLTAFLFVLFRANKQKQKDNILLAKQKEVLQYQKEEIEEINKDITDSLEYAKTLQEAMLEDITQINHIFPENFLLYLPRDIVSGDFYWIHEKDSKVFIAAADCTGHGVPGAFVSMLGNDLLNKIVIEKDNNDPGLILSELNREVQAVFKKENNKVTANDGMDIAFCVIDKNTKNIEFAGAMNPLIIIRNGEIIEQKATKSSIGGYTPLETEFVTTSIETQNNDSVYIFSDGYQDQFGGVKGKKFMAGKFRKLLSTLPELNYENQKTKLENNLYEWEGNYQRVDDILVIGFQIDK